jgi:hypothetical protein
MSANKQSTIAPKFVQICHTSMPGRGELHGLDEAGGVWRLADKRWLPVTNRRGSDARIDWLEAALKRTTEALKQLTTAALYVERYGYDGSVRDELRGACQAGDKALKETTRRGRP